MMAVIMALPLLGLVLFYILTFSNGTADLSLPAHHLRPYVLRDVHGHGEKKVRTGFEKMIGKEVVVFEDISPEGKVRIDNELWTAKAQRGRFLKGEMVRICGHEGLTLIVEALDEKEKPI